MYINQPISTISSILAEEVRDQTEAWYDQSFERMPKSYETVLLHPSGRRVELSVMNVPVEIQGQVVGNHLIIKDITEENRVKKKIKHQAYHDELTGLPNRRKFYDELNQAIEQHEGGASAIAVMVLDVDLRCSLITERMPWIC
ncbi:diguanylate cyclase domain-containing protein [Brevibacillus invocatus]|uniref:diguanylate cyclase domain-containing protein n=1 Tax=Brevibacillus invocatus TaxID=173959 RepID=UPI0030B84958